MKPFSLMILFQYYLKIFDIGRKCVSPGLSSLLARFVPMRSLNYFYFLLKSIFSAFQYLQKLYDKGTYQIVTVLCQFSFSSAAGFLNRPQAQNLLRAFYATSLARFLQSKRALNIWKIKTASLSVKNDQSRLVHPLESFFDTTEFDFFFQRIDYQTERNVSDLQSILNNMQNNQDFQPVSYFEASQEDYGRPKKQQKYVSGENNGKWSQLQHAKYIAYIEHNKDKMRSKEKRRVSKLYKEMAKYIKTRNAFQCRSHHQKLEDRHYFPNKIIAHYKKHNDLSLFDQCKLQLEELEPKPSALTTVDVKLQKKNVENVRKAQNSIAEPMNVMLGKQKSTPSTPVSNEAIYCAANANGYVSQQALEGNPFWGSVFFYSFYPVN